ncbi:hypothetical protein QB910_000083 [Dabrowskivirus KKP3916]|uniref:DNA primase n=1 Tax=Alicyclobacillus phage KKP_3916 TaxID=3040651 RepID=A0AAT9V8S5_9CAUD|nr:hypothetical protein QB910_000083 [Alicyclobacillus phage KKP 3916]
MDLKELKQKIYDDEEIETLLSALGCEHISKEQHGDLITAQLPSKFASSNRRSVQVKNTPSLISNIRTEGITGDIYSIVGYILYDCRTFDDLVDNLVDVKNWICEALGYTELLRPSMRQKETKRQREKKDWNSWLKNLRKKRGADTSNMTENEVIDEKVLDDYKLYPVELWIKEGITARTQLTFQVGFDIWSERIVFPVHNSKGELIGVKGRYIGLDQYIQDHQKYIYLHKCNKSLELFNYHRALPYIHFHKCVYVVEGAKTVMKAWSNGIRNMVSMEGDQLSPAQVQLLKDLGIDVEYIFAFDKDKDEKYVKEQIDKFTPIHKVSYLMDDDNIFEGKQSPLDLGVEAWYSLLNNKRTNK